MNGGVAGDIPHPPGCPACGDASPLNFIEDHYDRIGGKRYRILRCDACGVVSSDPRLPVGGDWYVKAAPIRDREARGLPENDARFTMFLAEGLPPGRLLDVGCGDGGFLTLAAAAGFIPFGFDYDPRMADKARARGLANVQSMEFSGFCAAQPPASFDAVTMFDVLEHTPEPAWFLGEVRRLLKPGGHVAITLPNAARPTPWGREEHDYPPHHFTRWSPDAMRGFLERQGFTVIHQFTGALSTRYLTHHFFFYRIMPLLLSLWRRLMFGRATETSAGAAPTLTELYDRAGSAKRGLLEDKLRRQKLVNAVLSLFTVLFLPFAAVLRWRYERQQPLSGECLYTLARYTPA